MQRLKRAYQKNSSGDPLNNSMESLLKYCVNQNSIYSRRIPLTLPE